MWHNDSDYSDGCSLLGVKLMKMEIRTKRVYEPAVAGDGFRVLVDRLWPRGLKKEQVQADLWLKDVAPTTALRQWFHHDPTQWEEFKSRYLLELEDHQDALTDLLAAAGGKPLTLLYSARDVNYNQAVVLKEFIRSKFNK